MMIDVTELSRLLVALAFLPTAAFLLLRLVEHLTLRPGPKEPPLVKTSVPFIGHILGLLRYGVSYYIHLR